MLIVSPCKWHFQASGSNPVKLFHIIAYFRSKSKYNFKTFWTDSMDSFLNIFQHKAQSKVHEIFLLPTDMLAQKCACIVRHPLANLKSTCKKKLQKILELVECGMQSQQLLPLSLRTPSGTSTCGSLGENLPWGSEHRNCDIHPILYTQRQTDICTNMHQVQLCRETCKMQHTQALKVLNEQGETWALWSCALQDLLQCQNTGVSSETAS